jgi:POT family proton-dependent oligopeptide transporter
MASEQLFFPALFCLILGNGAFRPNISTQVGLLYKPGDPRRDGAFTIFYMGVNLGAFLSPLVCGTLGQKVGWHYGFGAAGVGMILGLGLYMWGQKHLAPDVLSQKRAASAAGGAGAAHARERERMTREEWMRVLALVAICSLNVVFWACYEQQGNTMQLWADQNTNWSLLGWTIPSTWFQAFNPAMIFLFAPLLNILWAWQARRGKEPSSIAKMGYGCLLLGLSFIIMIVAAQGMAPDARRSVMWLTSTTFVLTIGELYLSPVGLSFVTKIAPARMVSMLMGVWYLASFFGNYLSGYLGTFWERISRDQFFLMLTLLGVAAGIVMLLLSRVLNRLVAGHDQVQRAAA